jgi:hypothetical protein
LHLLRPPVCIDGVENELGGAVVLEAFVQLIRKKFDGRWSWSKTISGCFKEQCVLSEANMGFPQ